MSSLTFSCPGCQRQYQRIKTEIRGYRVRCPCGFEFRVGDKSDRVPGIDRKVNRERRQRLLSAGRMDEVPPDQVWDEIEWLPDAQAFDLEAPENNEPAADDGP